MAIAEYVEQTLDKLNPPKGKRTPSDVETKLKRGRERLKQVSARRKEAIHFVNNEHYVRVAKDGLKLRHQSTVSVSEGGEKPDHRVRRSRDLIGPIVQGKVAAFTQRIPPYECIASSPDHEDYAAARLSEKIARAGHDLWQFRAAFRKAIWNALVTEEAFVMPYWDSTVGPYIDVSEHPENPEEPDPENPRYVGMGEVALWVGSGLELIWEPGVDFEKSRWWAIENAVPLETLEYDPEFIGPPLNADAEQTDSKKPTEKGAKLVMRTQYFERPCPKYPMGRTLVFANGREIFPEDNYPLQDAKGNIVDEPCIHRLTYKLDGSSDRDRGLVNSLVESMRSYDHVWNKAAEWIQIALIPQLVAPKGAIQTPVTDEPALLIEYDQVIAGQNGEPKWRTPPPIPPELFEVADRAQAEMNFIGQEESQAITQAESGKQAQAIASQALAASEDFTENLADTYARTMRDCLTLVQQRYTDERLVNFRGRTGWESIADFKGADLRGQTDVRVPPGALEPRTKAQTEQRIMNIAQMFPGYFPPEVLLSALEGGSAEKLIEGYEDDVARANRVVAEIRAGTFLLAPPRPVFPGEEAFELNELTGLPEIDPNTMQPILLTEVPGWMPRPGVDNIAVHKSVITTWMKTDDWDSQDEQAKQASMQYLRALLDLEMKEAQRKAQLQTQMAENQGMANAAKPQGGKPMPSLPATNGGEAS